MPKCFWEGGQADTKGGLCAWSKKERTFCLPRSIEKETANIVESFPCGQSNIDHMHTRSHKASHFIPKVKYVWKCVLLPHASQLSAKDRKMIRSDGGEGNV